MKNKPPSHYNIDTDTDIACGGFDSARYRPKVCHVCYRADQPTEKYRRQHVTWRLCAECRALADQPAFGVHDADLHPGYALLWEHMGLLPQFLSMIERRQVERARTRFWDGNRHQKARRPA